MGPAAVDGRDDTFLQIIKSQGQAAVGREQQGELHRIVFHDAGADQGDQKEAGQPADGADPGEAPESNFGHPGRQADKIVGESRTKKQKE